MIATNTKHYSIQILDQTGRIVLNHDDDVTKMDVSQMVSGVYLVRMLDEFGQTLHTKRLSVVR